MIPGFERFLGNAKSRGLEFAFFRGGRNIGEKELGYQGRGDIIIAPVICGSKRAGLLQTVVGIALIAAVAIFAPAGLGAIGAGGAWGITGAAGVSLAIGGVIQMLSPQAKGLKTSAAPENTPGYAFGSAKNTTASGNPVPLCYGKRRVGGAIISAAIYAEDQM